MQFGYKRLYIGGKLIDAASGERQEVICPATDEVVGEIAWAGKADAELALEEAQKGFKFWSKLSLGERTEWMTRLREEVLAKQDILRKAIVFEMGKSYEAAWEDIEALVNGLDFYPGAMRNLHDEIIPDLENTHRHKLVHQPAGVAVAYLAWNFPLLNVGFKLGPALAAGCSIIIKALATFALVGLCTGRDHSRYGFSGGCDQFPVRVGRRGGLHHDYQQDTQGTDHDWLFGFRAAHSGRFGYLAEACQSRTGWQRSLHCV